MIIRKLDRRRVAVLRDDGREQARFTNGTAKQNMAEAEAFAKSRKPVAIARETALFQTEVQTVSWITDGGDNSEPRKFGDYSVVRISDDQQREIVFLANELDALAATWVGLRAKMNMKPPTDLLKWIHRNTIARKGAE